MGRKPNSLILEYFERGAKLEDASNRYHHTCKACGEHFPKGRSDSLTAHLTRRCPSLSLAQRTAIVLQFHDLGDPLESKPATLPKGISRVEKNKSTKLPFSPSKQNFNALNVLAEASRRVGASQPAQPQEYTSIEQIAGSTLPVDPSLENDPFPHNFLNTSDDGLGDRVNGFSSSGPGVSALFPYISTEPHTSNNDSPQLTSMNLTDPDLVTHGPDLPSIAASANNMVSIHSVFDLSQQTSNVFGHFPNESNITHGVNISQPRPFSWPIPQRPQPVEQPGPESASIISATQASSGSSAQQLRPIAINPGTKSPHFIAESGTASVTEKHRKRGKFSDERREQVQRIRKMGACLRCRMLKKSCTGSDPCDVCDAVENPRLWKRPCVRTKLSAEFQLFHVGLQSALSYHTVSKLKAMYTFQQFVGQIKVSHLNVSKTITLKALKGQLTESEATESKDSICFLIDTDRDDVVAKIGQYLKGTFTEFLNHEASSFLTTTLTTAQHLSQQKSDVLLGKVLELWVATLILIDKNLIWKLVAAEDVPNEATSEAFLPSRSIDSNSDRELPLTEYNLPVSCVAVVSQLRVAVEKHAGALAKTVMGDLERRLLQRQQTEQFETFLVAVIYLNCVERATWMFQAWQLEPRNGWPLDKSAGDYAAQGDRFADILDMLLDMRSLPPKTSAQSEKDVLVPQTDVEVVRCWFEQIAITPEFLKHAHDKVIDADDCRSMDGKLFSKILRPENERLSKQEK